MRTFLSFLILSSFGACFAQLSCERFMTYYQKAAQIEQRRANYERHLETEGFFVTERDIEFNPAVGSAAPYDLQPEILTTTARLIYEDNATEVLNFGNYAGCTGRTFVQETVRSRYRAINGYANNLKNPYWGVSSTYFGRFAPKAYNDGIYTIRRSITGSKLPSPRSVVNEVLIKSVKNTRRHNMPNLFSSVFMTYVFVDFGVQTNKRTHQGRKDIRCCGSGNSKVLPKQLSHSACLPISIPDDDEFYSKGNIKCLNMVRSQLGTSPGAIQFGEIENKATSFLDHSIIYGTDDAMSRSVRTFSDGLIRLSAGNVVPVDVNGRIASSAAAFAILAQGSAFTGMFARNHNNLATELKILNPTWDDETLFREARKINIAIYQNIIYSGQFLEFYTGYPIRGAYDEKIDPSAVLEFSSVVARFLHYHVDDHVLVVDANGQVTKIFSSEIIDNLALITRFFDDTIRGTLNQPLNYGQYSMQIRRNYLANNTAHRGFGFDILSTNLLRDRDHGVPTYLNARKRCGHAANFKTFDDLLTIFPRENVELLKNAYASVEDIDLTVGGALENFADPGTAIFGGTSGCIAAEQFSRAIKGDAYFFSHTTHPNPFSQAQLQAIRAFGMSELICRTTSVASVPRIWYMTESTENPKMLCKDLRKFNLSPWMNI